jgi:hypothetical protein
MNIVGMMCKFIILALLSGIVLCSSEVYAALMALGDSELDGVQRRWG